MLLLPKIMETALDFTIKVMCGSPLLLHPRLSLAGFATSFARAAHLLALIETFLCLLVSASLIAHIRLRGSL